VFYIIMDNKFLPIALGLAGIAAVGGAMLS
jgi:hypothetical protein